jgi:hypothetical protein
VRWAFHSLVTLDELGELNDGIEVYSQPVEAAGPAIPFDHAFRPDESKPTQSV